MSMSPVKLLTRGTLNYGRTYHFGTKVLFHCTGKLVLVTWYSLIFSGRDQFVVFRVTAPSHDL